MTNISAFKIANLKGNPQYAVLVADSMASQIEVAKKDDFRQKLLVLNGALSMFSGDMRLGYSVYRELQKSNSVGPKSLAKTILDITTQNKVSPNMPLDFILSGFEDGEAKIYHINATGFNPYNPSKSKTSNKGAIEDFYAFSGSGAPFAQRVVEGQFDIGIDPVPKDIVSGISLIKNIAEATTASSGVNDKLQHGIITPNGMHVLFHPDIKFTGFDEHVDYFKRLLGFKLSPYGAFGTEERIASMKVNRPAWVVTRDFYNAFDFDFGRLQGAIRDYRIVCEGFKDKNVSFKRVEQQRTFYQEAKSLAEEAVTALLSGKSESVISYLKSERRNREQFYKQVSKR
jgi:hypothetical protein